MQKYLLAFFTAEAQRRRRLSLRLCASAVKNNKITYYLQLISLLELIELFEQT